MSRHSAVLAAVVLMQAAFRSATRIGSAGTSVQINVSYEAEGTEIAGLQFDLEYDQPLWSPDRRLERRGRS